jgi:hypothetical protein
MRQLTHNRLLLRQSTAKLICGVSRLVIIQQSAVAGIPSFGTFSDGFQAVYRGAPCPLQTSLGTGDLQVVPPMMSYDHMYTRTETNLRAMLDTER